MFKDGNYFSMHAKIAVFLTIFYSAYYFEEELNVNVFVESESFTANLLK